MGFARGRRTTRAPPPPHREWPPLRWGSVGLGGGRERPAFATHGWVVQPKCRGGIHTAHLLMDISFHASTTGLGPKGWRAGGGAWVLGGIVRMAWLGRK